VPLPRRSILLGLAGSVMMATLLGSCALPPSPATPEPVTIVIESAPVEVVPEVVVAEPEPVDPVTARIDQEIADLELREKLAGLMVVTIAGIDATAHREFLERVPAAGFLMLAGNLQGGTPAIESFMGEIQQDRELPLIISVDQEGSPIARIPGDTLPGSKTLGAGPLEATTAAFLARQEFVKSAGGNVNFGVVADVSGGRGAYIHSRSFSTDALVVSEHVSAALAAKVPGVAQTIKHFPGHGVVFVDTHKVVPSVDMPYDQWRSTHALPFVSGIAGGAELVMTAHIRVLTISKDPASLSDDWIAILRNDLGFEGVIVTDDLRMLKRSGEEAYQDPPTVVVQALVAGNDLLLWAVDPATDPDYGTYDRILDALVQAVISGQISEEQVDASLARVLRLRIGLATN
jgi:beta-N-acetylhexosaminidase